MTTALILIPLVAAAVVALVPWSRFWAGSIALLAALIEVGAWINVLRDFDWNAASLQHETDWTWYGPYDISYHVGMYGFSVWLVGLTVVAGAAALAYAFWSGRDRPRAYFALWLVTLGAIVGAFTAQDLLLFYVFFELMLIPLYVLIGVWGGPGRLRATITFVIYTMAGSLLMLAAIIVFGIEQGTFSLVDSGTSDSWWLFLGFAVAFAVKAPLFPFHGWLPDAYRESPADVSALLSGVISKVAAYGFLYIVLVHFPEPVEDFRETILALAAVGLVYASLLAFRAPDFRGVVLYSSMAQMGLIMLGVFAANEAGIEGSVLQMVNHGLLSTALFLLAGSIERRALTGEFASLGGMARGRPALATVLMIVGVIALAVPGSSQFAGEFLILLGVFEQGWLWAAIGAGAIVLAAMYMLRLISAVLHERVGSRVDEAALDLRPAELGIVVPLIACLLALSAWPGAITDRVLADVETGWAAVTQEGAASE